MEKWQYLVYPIRFPVEQTLTGKVKIDEERMQKEVTDILDEAGEEGWELVGIVPVVSPFGMTGFVGVYNCIFKQRCYD